MQYYLNASAISLFSWIIFNKPVLSGLEPIIGCFILERRNSSTTVLLGSAFRGIAMLKFITMKSVTVAAAAIIAGGMAIFVILAPPAKAQPQVASADC